MTIDEAIEELFESDEFKQVARNTSYLRTILRRYRNNELKSGAKVELLLEFGYTITAKKTARKKKSN
jgi:hypothetical protein